MVRPAWPTSVAPASARLTLSLIRALISLAASALRWARAHLGGHHGEAAALLAGTGGFHRGVERQDVGLEGDRVDDADDLGDARRRLVDVLHGDDHAAHQFAALVGDLRRVVRHLGGRTGVLGVLLHGGGDLVHRGGGLLQVAGLFLGALAQVGVAQRDLGAAGGGQVLVRHHFLSLDPYMRGRMSEGKSYAASQALGTPMIGGTVGEVAESRNPRFQVGDKVVGMGGWQQYSVVDAAAPGALRRSTPRTSRCRRIWARWACRASRPGMAWCASASRRRARPWR
jgi:hypothetical protein